MGIQKQVEQQAKHTQQIISNAIALLNQKSKAEKEQIHNVPQKLQSRTEEKLSELQQKLDPQLKSIETSNSHINYNASVKSAGKDDSDSHYYKKQIIEMAKEHGYYANCDNYKSWSRLIIYTGNIFEVVFSIHGYGHGDNGVMVVSGFTFEKFPSEETTSEATNIKPSHDGGIFQFNYLESEENILTRFEEWLEESLTIALLEWEKSIA